MLLFFNISGGEILVIVIVVYLVFGPKKIPEFARMLGKGINELRRATDDIKREFNREVNNVKKDINVDDPFEKKAAQTPPKQESAKDQEIKTAGQPLTDDPTPEESIGR